MSHISTRFKQFVADPARCSQVILEDLMNVTGKEVVDANNAFVMLLEMSTHLASQNLLANEIGLQRRYACLATTFQDLYPHLAPADIHNVFAKPTHSAMRISILMESLLATAINKGTYREAVIPKYTEITVDELVFSIDRAISIKIYANRIFKVEYIGGEDIHADVAMINSEITYMRQDGTLWVTFVLDVQQVNYTEVTLSGVSGSVFNEVVRYTNQLSSLEVLYLDGVYKPMQLALTRRAHDPLTPTAIITLDAVNKAIGIMIPSIYMANITGNIKVVIGDTLGDTDRVFSHYSMSDYTISLDTGTFNTTAEEAAFLSATSVAESISPLSGGRDALTFTQLRATILNRSFGHPELPISRTQFTNHLANHGLNAVLYEEGVGGRTYVVIDDTPHPTLKPLTPMALTVETYDDFNDSLTKLPTVPTDHLDKLAKYQTFDGLRSRSIPYDTQLPIGTMTLAVHYNELKELSNVLEFPNGLTLTASTLFTISGTNIIPTVITAAEIGALSTDTKVSVLNNNRYLFSLFYYSIKPNNGQWEIMPWSVSSPSVHIEDRIQADSSIPTLFRRDGYEIFKRDTGYVVRAVCDDIGSSNILSHTDTKVYLRLATPTVMLPEATASQGEIIHYLMDSYLEAGKMIYEVVIPCTWQFTDKYLQIVNESSTYLIDSTMWMDVVYCLNTPLLGYTGELASLVPDTTVAAMLHERIYVTFAEPLPNLWTNPHGVGDRLVYMRHPADVPYTVSESTAHSSIAEVIPFQIDDACNIVYKPTTVTSSTLIVDNKVVYKHRKGDLMLDPQGRPIPVNSDYQQIVFDIVCVDARAIYCTDTNVIDQLNLVERDIAYKCTSVILQLLPHTLERTNLFYRPIRTVGETKVSSSKQTSAVIPLNIRPTVVLGVREAVYTDSLARARLQNLTVQTINTSLTRETISYDRILSDLRAVYGASVISVKVNNLPDVFYTSAIHLEDISAACTVDVQLVSTAQGTLSLSDYISMEYIIV